MICYSKQSVQWTSVPHCFSKEQKQPQWLFTSSSAHRPSRPPVRWRATSCCTGSQGRVCRWSTASVDSRSALTRTWWRCRCSSPTTPPLTPRACTSRTWSYSLGWGSKSFQKLVSCGQKKILSICSTSRKNMVIELWSLNQSNTSKVWGVTAHRVCSVHCSHCTVDRLTALLPFCSSVLLELLPAGETATAVMGIDFCDSTQAANFQLWWDGLECRHPVWSSWVKTETGLLL